LRSSRSSRLHSSREPRSEEQNHQSETHDCYKLVAKRDYKCYSDWQ